MTMDPYTHRLTLQGPTGQRDIDLSIGSLIIGRQVGCDLVLEDTLISRRHARLDCSAMDCTITDLNSSNGTRVNGERLVPDLPRLLAPGEIIQVGAYSLTYQQTPLTEPAPEPPPPAVEDKPKVEPKPKPAPEQPIEEKLPVKPPKKTTPAREEPPAQPPPPPKKARPQAPPPAPGPVPPGMEMRSTRLIQYLPDIYHTDFMARFLGIFEATSTPIEWTIDNFDLFLSPASAPPGFLPWLANWFNIPLDASWTEEKRRILLAEAHEIYARLGTRWSLCRILEIYTGVTPEIDDTAKDLEPHSFRVRLPIKPGQVNQTLVERLINSHKPAYTTYTLEFK